MFLSTSSECYIRHWINLLVPKYDVRRLSKGLLLEARKISEQSNVYCKTIADDDDVWYRYGMTNVYSSHCGQNKYRQGVESLSALISKAPFRWSLPGNQIIQTKWSWEMLFRTCCLGRPRMFHFRNTIWI